MHVLVAAARTRSAQVVMWSQTLLYGAHPSNPNFLSERHPLRARRTRAVLRRQDRGGERSAAFGQRAARRTVDHPPHRADPRADGAQLRHALPRPAHRADDDGLRPARAVPARGRRHRRVQARDRSATCRATFNIVGDGVLPLSTVIQARRAHRAAGPPPARRDADARCAGLAQIARRRPSFFDYLRFLCVADGRARARSWAFARPTRRAKRSSISRARSACVTSSCSGDDRMKKEKPQEERRAVTKPPHRKRAPRADPCSARAGAPPITTAGAHAASGRAHHGRDPARRDSSTSRTLAERLGRSSRRRRRHARRGSDRSSGSASRWCRRTSAGPSRSKRLRPPRARTATWPSRFRALEARLDGLIRSGAAVKAPERGRAAPPKR